MRFKISIIIFGLFISFSLVGRVFALDYTPPPFKDTNFSGKYVSQTIADPISIPAGSTKEVTVKIKNTGSATWYRSGTNFVSAYTIDPNYHKSVFYNSSWLGVGQVAKISRDTKPGEIAEITLKLQAPAKVGDYTEKFFLAAENKTWITGTYFFLKVRSTAVAPVPTSGGEVPLKPVADIEEVKNTTTPVADGAYKTVVVIRSAQSVSAIGGDKIHYIVRFLNRGTTAWQNHTWKENGSRTAGEMVVTGLQTVALSDGNWQDQTTVFTKTQVVEPGKPLEVEFDFRAPKYQGNYSARFQLWVDGKIVEGGDVEVPVYVTANAPAGYQEPNFNVSNITPSARQLVPEPNIEVGLYKTDAGVQFQSPYSYSIYAGEELKGVLPANEIGVLSYAHGFYTFASISLQFYSSQHIRLVPSDMNHYFKILSYERKVEWKGGSTNFNVYRGIMSYKYSPKSNTTFVVNELPLNAYVAGIAETSNGAHIEYIKAILVAARSYAYYHLNNGVPAEERTFDVYATTADQLYLGYNSEILGPRIAEASKATWGEMVTYNGEPVVTPYFGHSDGKTRTWQSVWGGTNKPWLQSVVCKYDAGRTMFGHGVGMSALDASGRATHDGWDYKKLLGHYYTGTVVERVY